jgi:hypothetical protein
MEGTGDTSPNETTSKNMIKTLVPKEEQESKGVYLNDKKMEVDADSQMQLGSGKTANETTPKISKKIEPLKEETAPISGVGTKVDQTPEHAYFKVND